MNADPNNQDLFSLEATLEQESWVEARLAKDQKGAKQSILELENLLRAQPRAQPPPHFARDLAVTMLEISPTPWDNALQPPNGFASTVSQRIATEAEQTDAIALVLRNQARVVAPHDFANNLATRIQHEASVETGFSMVGHERTPLYFLGATLLATGLLFTGLAWPFIKATAAATLALATQVEPSTVGLVLLVAVLALLASSGRVRTSLPASLTAFALLAGVMLPQIVPMFGAARVAAGQEVQSVVRAAGDLSIAGTVRGDVVSLGGAVRLEPGAVVEGRVLTFMGDVEQSEGATVTGGVRAVIGAYQGEAVSESKTLNLPGMSAANALRPLRQLLSSSSWIYLVFALLAALASGLALIPGWVRGLEQSYRTRSGQALGLGVFGLMVVPPLVALAGLSAIGAPVALLLTIAFVVLMALGLAASGVSLGHWLRKRLRLGTHPAVAVVLGLGVLLLAVLWTPLGLVLLGLAGAWGAGALLLAWQHRDLA